MKLDLKQTDIEGSMFYEDNFIVGEYNGKIILNYLIEDDVFVSVMSEKKAEETIKHLSSILSKIKKTTIDKPDMSEYDNPII